jgi:hypothetical protein
MPCPRAETDAEDSVQDGWCASLLHDFSQGRLSRCLADFGPTDWQMPGLSDPALVDQQETVALPDSHPDEIPGSDGIASHR